MSSCVTLTALSSAADAFNCVALDLRHAGSKKELHQPHQSSAFVDQL